MKKAFSKIKLTAIMAFASIASIVSKTMWQVWWWEQTQWFYWVARTAPISPITVKEPSASMLTETIIKCIEWALVGVIVLIGIINFFKIRKIDDKELRAKKIKKTIIIIAIIAVIDILIALWYWMYDNNMFDNLLG